MRFDDSHLIIIILIADDTRDENTVTAKAKSHIP